MSKLFDTLEQIRQNETADPSKPAPVLNRKPAKRKTRWAALVPVLLLAGVVLAYILVPNLTGYLPQQIATIFLDSQPHQTASSAPDNMIEPSGKKTTSVEKNTKTAKHSPPAPQKAGSLPQAGLQAKPVGQMDLAALQVFTQLNNQGVKLIAQQNYWQGIHTLNKAISMQPKRIEPYINIGVALSELGLYGPAIRYFQKAKQIEPANEKLIANFDLFRRAGLLETIQ